MAKKQTYDEAIAELNQILVELEEGNELNMELISKKVKRAAVLIDFCRKQLNELDTDLEKLLEKLD